MLFYHGVYVGRYTFRGITAIMEHRLENQMENEVESTTLSRKVSRDMTPIMENQLWKRKRDL